MTAVVITYDHFILARISAFLVQGLFTLDCEKLGYHCKRIHQKKLQPTKNAKLCLGTLFRSSF